VHPRDAEATVATDANPDIGPGRTESFDQVLQVIVGTQ